LGGGLQTALRPKFCCLLLTSGGANVMSGFAPLMLRPMAVKGIPPGNAAIAIGIPPGDKGIVLAFVAIVAAASMFLEEGMEFATS
jgi:hypothetical protein